MMTASSAPMASRRLAVSIFSFLMPSALPCSMPSCLAPSSTERVSRYLRSPSSYFMRSALVSEATSAICSSLWNTALCAFQGSLVNVSIFLSTYIHLSKSLPHSSGSLSKSGNCMNVIRILSENSRCVFRSASTTSVRNLASKSIGQKLRNATRYTASMSYRHADPRSPCLAMASEM